MPGSARRVRPAYSRTLCLPCLKAGFFCFLHYRYHYLYVQLFIFNFLCICLLLFGTSFFSFHPFITFLRWLFTTAAQASTGASRRANRAGLQLRWCRSPTRPPKLHTRPHRAGLGLRWCRFKPPHRGKPGRVWFFSPERAYPSP